MLLSRSLTSLTGKDRSTRASPSTCPSRRKWPTPLENSTTRLTGSCSARATGASFGAGPVGPAGERDGKSAQAAPAASAAPATQANTHLRFMTLSSFAKAVRGTRGETEACGHPIDDPDAEGVCVAP